MYAVPANGTLKGKGNSETIDLLKKCNFTSIAPLILNDAMYANDFCLPWL